ncbi:MAG: hypothetical protein M3081_21635 [Gemmatimonadota bacterium]|nr:hypothetical protein [Gemmatimonadota bacterium]
MTKLRALAPLGAFTRRRVIAAAATALLFVMPTCPPKQATDPDPFASRPTPAATVVMVVSGQH